MHLGMDFFLKAGGNTIFIDKGNKKKVRPITLASYVSKIMEKLINYKFVLMTENREWFNNTQNSFREERSCLDNLCRLNAHIELGNE